MSAKSFNNIVIKGDPLRKEANAGGTITPGHLLRISATDTVVVDNAAAQNSQARFAVEADMIGKDIDDNYSADDRVQYVVARTGDELFGLVLNGAAAITLGDPLESAGDGTLQKHVPDTVTDATGTSTLDVTIHVGTIVGYALEAIDNSGGSAATRIHFEAR